MLLISSMAEFITPAPALEASPLRSARDMASGRCQTGG